MYYRITHVVISTLDIFANFADFRKSSRIFFERDQKEYSKLMTFLKFTLVNTVLERLREILLRDTYPTCFLRMINLFVCIGLVNLAIIPHVSCIQKKQALSHSLKAWTMLKLGLRSNDIVCTNCHPVLSESPSLVGADDRSGAKCFNSL